MFATALLVLATIASVTAFTPVGKSFDLRYIDIKTSSALSKCFDLILILIRHHNI